MATPALVDKASRTLGRPQYHIRLKPGDVGAFINTLFIAWHLVATNTVQGFG